MQKQYTAFYLFVASIFLFIVAPALFSDGMFMDGLLYAAISNNIANGIGDIWHLVYTNNLDPQFHGHPPLAFAIQSIFFYVFGDSILVERFYSLSTFVVMAYIIVLLWREITEKIYHKLAFLPLLFWTLIPLVTWSATNNMLENTMMIFVNLSVLFGIKSFNKNRLLFLLLAGFMLFLGVLTKGVIALFPLALIFWIFVFNKDINFKRFIVDLSVMLLGLIIPFVLLFIIIPESYDSLMAYYNIQLVNSVSSGNTVDTRFYIIFKLITEILIIGIISILVLIFTRKKISLNRTSKWKYILLALSLSGVVPIMVSMKQSGFYMVPVFPLISILMVLLISPSVKYLVDKIDFNSRGFIVFKYISIILFIASIAFNASQINTIGRDKQKLEDIYSIIEIVPNGSDISIEPIIRNQWSLHGYFQRYGFISLDHHIPLKQEYLLVLKDSNIDIPENYKVKDIDLNLFRLYQKIRVNNQ